MMTFGSLFSGIGGMDLGLERAGLTCEWQVEIDPFCRKVLAKHWPDVPKHDDVRTFIGEGFERVDLICGGFPCQDVSDAGLRTGIEGDRSGLWADYARILRLLRPRFVLVENSPGLLVRGFQRVLGDLAEIGFDAEWALLSAAQFGAHHIRQRLFILAYARGERWTENEVFHSSALPSVPSKADGPDPKKIWMSGLGRRIGRSGRIIPDSECFRVADGFPTQLDRSRVKGIGNAVVPQVAEWIGKQLMHRFQPDKESA